jgi:hypothetical protein
MAKKLHFRGIEELRGKFVISMLFLLLALYGLYSGITTWTGKQQITNPNQHTFCSATEQPYYLQVRSLSLRELMRTAHRFGTFSNDETRHLHYASRHPIQ